jgi:uncharacterized protein with beta-barrel porin domain
VSFPSQPAISLGVDDNLTNLGTIAFQDNSALFFRTATILGGETVINDGSITAEGANGILNATTVVNRGEIRVREASVSTFDMLAAISGSQMVTNSGSILLDGANGVVGAAKVINSGTIGRVQDGAAGTDILNVAAVINSGTIGSIGQTSWGFMSINNRAGGVIGEIRSLNSEILNAGTIEGDVIVDGLSTIFVNAGGQVLGDIRPADPNSFSSLTVIERHAEDDGVKGTIDAGLGFDSYVTSFSSTGSYNLDSSLPAGFEFGGVEALGTNTIVTLTSVDSSVASEGVVLFGSGSIINNGNIGPASLEGTGFPTGALISRPSAIVYGGDIGKTAEFTSFFSNSSIRYGSALTVFTNNGTIDGDLRIATASFTNTGEISLLSRDLGTMIRTAADTDFTFTNSGSITRTNNGARFFPDYYDPQNATINIRGAIDSTMAKAVSVSNSGEIAGGFDLSSVASSFAFDNSGTISGMTIESGGPFFVFTQYVDAVRLNIGGTPFSLEGLEANATTARISNSGLIDGGITASLAALDTGFVNDGEITKRGNDPSAVYLDTFACGLEGDDDDAETDIDAQKLSFVNNGDIGGAVAIDTAATEVIVTNTGTVAAEVSGFATFSPLVLPGLGVENETVGSSAVSFNNSGSISTSEYASPGVLLHSAAGEGDDGDVDLSLPPVEGGATAQITAYNSGTIRASGGEFIMPRFFGGPPALSVAQSAGLVVLAEGVGATSALIENRAGGVINALGAPHVSFSGQVQPVDNAPENAGGIAIAASADNVTIRNEGQIIGGPAMVFDPAIVTVNLPNGLDVEGLRGGAIDTILSKDLVINTVTGSIGGGIALRGGDDRLENYGSIDGNVYLGNGDDTFVHGINASFTGTADGGAGTDGLVIDITGGGMVRNALFDQFVNFETTSFTGSGSIQTEGALAVDSLELSDGQLSVGEGTLLQTASATAIRGNDMSDEDVVNQGTINGDIVLAGGNDGVENHALIDGNVSLGDGNDQFANYDGSTVTGQIDGGLGSDRLRLNLAGNRFDFGAFENFEELDLDQGTGSYGGEVAFDVIKLNGGRLIGLADSTLTSGEINVVGGATFGSAGTVNGDISVSGTLSPGASPGTMTVNGDVTLASGSSTFFEMTPTVSDALVIHGGLTVATGATFTLTGERPLTPGISYDLIVADDGITGSFTTINKASTVLGFLRQTADRVQLLGQFQLQPGSSTQVTATVNYLNTLLIGGSAPAGLIDAVPTLLTASGFADSAKIGRLNPEPYASASQIGVENGLAIVSALRSTALADGKDDAGLFGFGQGFGSWRRLPGSAAVGTSSANIRNYGFLGGIGLGSQSASIGAFVGYINARQSIGALGATSRADGVVAGLIAQAKLGGFELGAVVLRDGSSADTERSLASGSTASSHYKLRGWTADLNAGYAMPIGAGWTLRPEIGFTHISSRRGTADESGAGGFSLNVDARLTKASFASGSLTLKGDVAAKVRPWFTAGIRHQFEGRRSFATAGLTGVTLDFTVPGASRSATLASVSAGVSAAVSTKVEIFAGGKGEFGSDSSGESANLGLRLRF